MSSPEEITHERSGEVKKEDHGMLRGITAEWSIDIDDTYQHRVENGSLIFWKPGRTIYIIVWGRPNQQPKEQTLAWIKSQADPNPPALRTGNDLHPLLRLLAQRVR
jgi:hypothetical protein